MKKSGQITIFIMIGIVTLFLIAGVYYFVGDLKNRGLNSQVIDTKKESDSLYQFTRKCIEDASISTAFYIGEHGGFDEIPAPFVKYDGNTFAKVYQYNAGSGTKLLLSLPEVEKNYANVAERRTLQCVADFKVFKDLGYAIEYQAPELTAKIEKEYVLVTPKFRLTSNLSNTATISFYEFSPIKIPLRLGRYYEIANYLIEESIREPDYIKATYLGDLYDTEAIEFHVPAIPKESAYAYFLLDDRDNAEYRRLINNYNNNNKFAFLFAMKFG